MHGTYKTRREAVFSVRDDGERSFFRGRMGRQSSVEPDGQTIESPIFLVGSVRSGTTLLRLMLDHHPEMAFFHEFPYAVEKIPDEGWPDLADYYEYLATHRIFQDSDFAIDTRLDYPRLMNSFLSQKLERDGKRLVGATVHVHFDRLLRIWPDARFLHIIRDGRDVARSRVELGWAGNVYTGVQTWIDAERLWEKLRKEIPESHRLELKYENLVLDAEGELGRICDFLDLPYDSSMLRYDETSTYSAPDPGLIAQWRRKLSPSALRLVESRISDMLVERGYELSGEKPLEVGPIRERLIQLDDRRNRLAARRRAYGTATFAAELAMRSLEPVYRRLANFRKDVLSRINDIERATLK